MERKECALLSKASAWDPINIVPLGNKGFLFERIHMRDLFATTEKRKIQQELTRLM
jgi:hypothetical protein